MSLIQFSDDILSKRIPYVRYTFRGKTKDLSDSQICYKVEDGNFNSLYHENDYLPSKIIEGL